MIIENNFASDILEKIEEELNLYENHREIEFKDYSILKMNPNFELIRNTQYYSLPIFSSGAKELIQITREFYEILTSNWEKEHPKLVINGLQETINSNMKNDFPCDTIYSAIFRKISNLVDSYDMVLKATRESNQLFGIKEEEKILLIHLNKYDKIINSDSEQINIIQGITLNKKISDLVLEIYIRFIERRLKMLKPEYPKLNTKRNGELTKILWKGGQKDLLELIVELQEKGWIEKFKYGEINKMAKSICNLFDLSLTKKNEESDPCKSFYQILKGVNNKKTKIREYDEILGDLRERKFEKIKENGC